ncbi:hypothetical protein ACQ4PT_048806 [Festuca glaucescens]
MAMEPLPLGFGDFSITMDASLASLWPLIEDAPHCHQPIVEELKQKLATATAELEVVREEVRLKEKNIAALMDLIRGTAQDRDFLRQQRRLLLDRELASATSGSGSDSDPAGDDRSTLFKLPSSAEAAAVVDRPSALFEAPSVENKSAAAAAAAAGQLELLAAKRPLPHKGRLLQAVMEAGPLLQNLLVAGPLPRWRNPPPAQALTNAMISAPSGSGVELLTARTGS